LKGDKARVNNLVQFEWFVRVLVRVLRCQEMKTNIVSVDAYAMTMEDHVITIAERSEEFRICVAEGGMKVGRVV